MTAQGRSELADHIRLAIPLAAQQLGVSLMGTVDAMLLGRYSDSAIAAAGVGNNLFFAITAVGMGVVMGLDTVIPQAIGAGRLDDARRYRAAGMRLAVMVGLVSTLLVMASPLVLRLTNTPADVAAEAQIYTQIRALGVAPFLMSIALRSYLAARHVTRPLVIAVIAANIANAAIASVLIFGIEAIGLPALGVIGAAVATVSVQIVIALVYAAGARALDNDVAPPPATRKDIVEIVRYGGPVGGQIAAEVGIFGVATVIAAHLGKLPAAGHSVALNISSFTFALALGVGAATSVRVGHAVGAGDIALARRRGLLGLGLVMTAMLVPATVFVTAPALVASLYTDDAALIAAAIPLMQIAAVFQLSDGAQAVGAGALRGLGHTRATLVGNLLGHYAIGLPVALGLAFTAGLGASGMWWGLSAGLTATALYLNVVFVLKTRTRSPR